MPEIIRRYEAGEITTQEIIDQYGIPKTTLYRYFKDMGVKIKTAPEMTKIKVEKALRDKETAVITDEALKIYDVAIGLGTVIARRYTPLIDHLMSQGQTIELIAEDVMMWFETKTVTQNRIDNLQSEIGTLNQQLREAYETAEPNYLFKLKSERLLQFANEAMRWKALGLRIPVKSAVRAFQGDLDKIEIKVKNMKEAI